MSSVPLNYKREAVRAGALTVPLPDLAPGPSTGLQQQVETCMGVPGASPPTSIHPMTAHQRASCVQGASVETSEGGSTIQFKCLSNAVL